MSSTCFQGSGDSATALNPAECVQSPSVKSIPTPEPCCDATGPTRPSSTTSDLLRGRMLPTPSTLSVGAIPASPSAWPDCATVRLIQDISGRRCIALYEQSGRDGSLPRTLLDIFGSVSTPWPMRWKLRTSPSGRLLFQLAPLARRIAGTGSGLLPTPTASDCKGASDNCKRIKTGDVSYLRYFLHFHLKPSHTSWPHPCFVERLMGYPIGHTDLGPSATRSFRKSRRSSEKRSSPVSDPDAAKPIHPCPDLSKEPLS
jgi:hypothetical protein